MSAAHHDFADTKAVESGHAPKELKREIARLQIVHGMAVNGTARPEYCKNSSGICSGSLRSKEEITHLTLGEFGSLFNRFNDAAERIGLITIRSTTTSMVCLRFAQLNLLPIELALLRLHEREKALP